MSVFAWGLGKNGQLGRGSEENGNIPVVITYGASNKTTGSAGSRRPLISRSEGHKESAVCIGAGGMYTGIVLANGKMYCCGSGKHGRLGTAEELDCHIPKMVSLDEDLTFISCGIWHGAAVSRDGKLYIWGYNKSHGTLGLTPQPSGNLSKPLLIDSLSTHHIVGVSCGNNYTLAWDNNGDLFSWGCGRHGVLGHGSEEDKHQPTKVNYIEGKVIHADAGFAHSGIVTEDGDLYMCGKGQCGALGLGQGRLQAICTFTRIDKPVDVFFKEITCSKGEHHGHTLALSVTGEVYAWGDGYKGKLGLGDQESRFLPCLVPRTSFNDEEIIQVSAGGIHSAAVSVLGHVYTWGCGSDGRLGHPEAKGHRYLFRTDVPRIVEELRDKGKAVSVKASYYHTVALVDGK